MARSSDRTLLAALGFADQDKKDKRHDLACRYLALPETANRLVDTLVPRHERDLAEAMSERESERSDVKEFRGRRVLTNEIIAKPILEKPISKGEGQYKTTIGFVDLVIPFNRLVTDTGEQRKRSRLPPKDPKNNFDYGDWGSWGPLVNNVAYRTSYDLFVEVKIGRAGLGDLLRQIKLYREHLGDGRYDLWLAATAYDLPVDEVQAMKNEKIHHIRLGAKFEQYVNSIGSTEIAKSREI